MQLSLNCGGSNDDPQRGVAVGQITVPAGKQVSLGWEMSATVESEDAGYDFAEFRMDTLSVARIDSKGEGGGCDTSFSDTKSGVEILPSGIHTLEIEYDTVDAAFHDEDYGVDFQIVSCTIVDI